jgi:hypothetical protein
MSPVGGSRHYQGGGLGVEGGWGCPSCGADNAGPIAQGCAVCGAGRPGRHIGTTPPAPEPAAEPEAPEAPAQPVPDNAWTRWIAIHPEATMEQAFIAGYVEGIRASTARQAPVEPPLGAEGKVVRTILAALSFFADQVLTAAPVEVENGEWCSADEVRNLIHQLATTGEVHA